MNNLLAPVQPPLQYLNPLDACFAWIFTIAFWAVARCSTHAPRACTPTPSNNVAHTLLKTLAAQTRPLHTLPTAFRRGRAQLHGPNPPLTENKPSPPAESQSPCPSAVTPPSAALHISRQYKIVCRGQQHTLFYSLILILKPSLNIQEGPLIMKTLCVNSHTYPHIHTHTHTYIHIQTN
jgi:hypothetical protein